MPKDNKHSGGWEHRDVHNVYGAMLHEAASNVRPHTCMCSPECVPIIALDSKAHTLPAWLTAASPGKLLSSRQCCTSW